jgi:toxin ParE1/3/4
VPIGHAVTFAESAVADLEEIRAWYVGLDVPEVGERLLREIVSHVERLAEFPRSGRVVPEFGIDPLREIIHPPFRIVYRVDEDRVRVVRVWRSERLLDLSEQE